MNTQRLANESLDAFCQMIVTHFPPATTGDLSPLPTVHTEQPAEPGIEEWISNIVTTLPSDIAVGYRHRHVLAAGRSSSHFRLRPPLGLSWQAEPAASPDQAAKAAFRKRKPSAFRLTVPAPAGPDACHQAAWGGLQLESKENAMPNKHHTTPKTGQYRYYRDFTGAAARIRIEDPQGNGFLHIYFWDDPDTAEALLADTKAKMLVAALNLTGGGQVELPQLCSILQERRQIATIWSVHDLQQVRPDLTAGQAWEVLQRVDRHHDADHGIARDTILLAAEELFPASGQQKLKRRRAKKPRKLPTLDEIRF